jgi:hypothetical protein
LSNGIGHCRLCGWARELQAAPASRNKKATPDRHCKCNACTTCTAGLEMGWVGGGIVMGRSGVANLHACMML